MDPVEFAVAFAIIGGAVKWIDQNAWARNLIIAMGKRILRFLPGYTTKTMLQEIIKELNPNGGSSLRDIINRIEKEIIINKHNTQLVLRMQRIADDRNGIATLVTDHLGKCTYANRHYTDLVGLTEDEVLGDGWKNVMSSTESSRISAIWKSVVEDQRDFHEIITYTHPRTGVETKAQADAYLVSDNGVVIGWVSYIQTLNGRRACDKNPSECNITNLQ